MTYQLPEGHVLVLRTSKSDLTSYNGFQWPESGFVEAPDWNPEPACGHGLHGALWGEGNGHLFNWDPDATWQVVEVLEDHIIDLDGKVKFPSGNVVFSGPQFEATEFLRTNGGSGKATIGGTANAGDYGTANAGDFGTANAGDYGTANAGFKGMATAGYKGTANAGYKGTATARDRGTATAGEWGTANAGFRGTANAGINGVANVGYKGTATAGDGGTATAGKEGTANAGNYGKTTAGDWGTISLKYFDGRSRTKIGYIGEDGLEPNVAYKLDENHNFVPAN